MRAFWGRFISVLNEAKTKLVTQIIPIRGSLQKQNSAVCVQFHSLKTIARISRKLKHGGVVVKETFHIYFYSVYLHCVLRPWFFKQVVELHVICCYGCFSSFLLHFLVYFLFISLGTPFLAWQGRYTTYNNWFDTRTSILVLHLLWVKFRSEWQRNNELGLWF